MNAIDRLVGFFSPERGLARARARRATRIYDGAASGRRSSSWQARHTSANAEIQLALRPLRDRARDLVRNTPHAARMIDVFVSHAVGTGLRPVASTGSRRVDTKITDLWNDWQAQADVEGVQSFAAMQCLGMRSMMESGEIFFRFIDRRPGDPGVKSPIPLKLQMLEADFVDQYREGIYGLNAEPELLDLGLTRDTLRSRLGIGLGEYDRRTGFWILPYHPGEITTYNLRPGISRFVPESEILHIYRPTRPGQVRGVSWFAPTLQTSRDLADFLDAALVKARVEACFAGFVTNPDDFEPLMDPSTPDSGLGGVSGSNPDAMATTLEPGMLKELRGGQDIKFAQPTTATQLEPILMFNLMSMAAGVGVTYDQLSGDLRQANYSSLRAGKIDFRRLVEQVQTQVLIPMLCKPVWERFINRAILAGQLIERKDGYPCNWVTPAWESVNPKFDLEAELHSVRAGRMTPQEFIASWGSDWRTVLDDFAEFKDEAEKRDLVFESLANQTNRQGMLQKPPGQPGNKPGKKPGEPAPGQDVAAEGNGHDNNPPRTFDAPNLNHGT